MRKSVVKCRCTSRAMRWSSAPAEATTAAAAAASRDIHQICQLQLRNRAPLGRSIPNSAPVSFEPSATNNRHPSSSATPAHLAPMQSLAAAASNATKRFLFIRHRQGSVAPPQPPISRQFPVSDTPLCPMAVPNIVPLQPPAPPKPTNTSQSIPGASQASSTLASMTRISQKLALPLRAPALPPSKYNMRSSWLTPASLCRRR
jgi:hypothetical protein